VNQKVNDHHMESLLESSRHPDMIPDLTSDGDSQLDRELLDQVQSVHEKERVK
jgi:hypothetical protein